MGDLNAGDARPISAPAPSRGARLDVVDVVPILLGIGRIWFISNAGKAGVPPLGVPGREVYTGSVAMVSFLLSIGIPGSLSSPPRLGRVAFRSSGGSSPAFLAALSSFFFRALSWSSIAALTFLETIFINLLLIFRSQYPERPPSSLGIQPQRKKTKNKAARISESMEKAQITSVKTMPERISACW